MPCCNSESLRKAWHQDLSLPCRKLVVPGDLRSYGGGNGLPRAVRQSPNISQIAEEDEDVEENKHDMSTLLVRNSEDDDHLMFDRCSNLER
jgi:hypothetical protein